MSMMNGKNAAILANGAYGVMPAVNNDEALQLAREETRFTQNPTEGPALSVPVTPRAGFVGRSGTIIKETAGFGTLLERHGGIDREFVLVMRGTVSKMDWLSNVNVGMTRGPGGSMVHAGFASIYESMQIEVASMLRRANAKRVHFVGHSLGGALASLAALHYASSGQGATHLYTFGAPRIGGQSFTADIKKYIGVQNVKRVYALSDPVPMIPLFPFFHCQAGASGINAQFSAITADAHSMSGCYVPQMPAHGWPAQIAQPNKADPDYWLRQAEGASGIGSKMGYYFLGKALSAMMPALHALCGGLSVGMTMLDLLSEAMKRAMAISERIGKLMLRFVRSALRFTVGVVDAGMTVADLTLSFLRYVLGLMLSQVLTAARVALSALV